MKAASHPERRTYAFIINKLLAGGYVVHQFSLREFTLRKNLPSGASASFTYRLHPDGWRFNRCS